MASISSDSLTVTCIFILSLEMLIGTSCTIFILGVIFKESKQKKFIKTGNKIRIALYTSNVCYSITVYVGVITGILVPRNNQINSTLAHFVYSLNMFTMSSSSWLTATLSLFYCMKIVDFKNRAIVWAKKKINTVVPWMIMGVEVLALFSSFLGMLLFMKPHCSPLTNSTLSLNNSVSSCATGFLSIALAASFAPFLIIVINSSCIFRTFTNHSLNIAESMGTSTNNKTTYYENSVRKLIQVILNYTVYYLLVLLYYVATLFHLNVEFWVFLLLISSFIPIQSVQQIFIDPKLKKIAKDMLKCTFCSQMNKRLKPSLVNT